MNDQVQRDEALDVTQSFIVQAPAGSGKTELLTQRYLKLLSISNSPENVIAMTFTKKAVNEMTTRVINALKSTEDKRPSAPHKQITYDLANKVMDKSRECDWQLLTMPHRLKISTIDGLSSLISNRYPSKNQLTVKQIIVPNWEREKIYNQAAKQTLLLINDNEYQNLVGSVLLYLDNNVNKFYRLVTTMLAKRDQWLTKLYRHGVLDTKALQASANQIIIQHLELLKTQVRDCFDERFFALLKTNTKLEYSQIQSIPDANVESLEAWCTLKSLCLDSKNKWRKTLNKNNGFPPESKHQKQALINLLQTFSSNEKLTDLLITVELLPDADFSNTQTHALKDISAVLRLAVAQLNILFENEQAYDFIQVALDADNALNDNKISDVSLFLDYKVQHILIDEFQDTSNTQFALLEKLIANWQIYDGKTLFLVGDPMQSIYLFRQSQVGLFLQVCASGIAKIKPKFLQLSTNFRSSKSVVETNNAIFSKIFPEQDDVYKGAIRYTNSNANSTDENIKAIEFHPFSHQRYDLEAQKVLEIINNNPQVEIAILVRNRSHLDHIVPKLKNANIKFEALKTSALKDHLFTRDLFSLTRALLHLGDKLAWLSILRAPWCGLLLADLLILSQVNTNVVFDSLNNQLIMQKLSKDGQLRANNLLVVLQNVIHNQSRFSFVERLSYAINQLVPMDCLSVQQSMIKEQFLQIINDCESVQQLNLGTIKQMLSELYAPSASARIKLMTIHQAKGLEFELIIIPGLGRATKNNKPPIIYMQEFSNQSLLLAPIKSYTQTNDSNTYNYLKYIELQQNKFEAMRLLYVAMTRAQNKVYLLATVNKKNQASSNTFLKLLEPMYQNQFGNIETPIIDVNQQQVKIPQLIRRSELLNHTNLSDKGIKKIDFELSTATLFKSILGVLIHQYFEKNIFIPNKVNIEAKLIESGFASTDIDDGVDFITKMLNNTKNDANFDWLFKQRNSTLVEAEFISADYHIIIDRLFIDNDILWVIDFKTTIPTNGESISQFNIRQKTQHSQQLLHYKNILSQIYTNEIKCALYCPAVQQLIEINNIESFA